ATSLIKPKIVQYEVINAIKNLTANPGRSGHNLSQKVALKIFETREILKDFFNANNYEIIFTKNCTEALNLAILGTLQRGDHVIATCYEHNSVLRPLEELKKGGVEVTIVDCDLENFHKEFEREIKFNTKLIVTTFISNVTGEICDVESVNKICKKHKILHLVDGAQACGHIEIDMEKIDADMFAFAGHKGLLSLTGVGGLFVKNLKILKPIIFGGTGTESENLIQPTDTIEGFEAGTVSSISIISLNAGVSFLQENFSKILEKEKFLSEFLIKKLKKLDFLTVFSKETSKNVFSFNVKNIDSATVANVLNDKFNICVRPGLHCAPLIHKRNKTNEGGCVRVSLDYNNSIGEIEYLIHALKTIVNV
ncbi:MAG: aminotransferase class V-fold PLP-dependent enzyme, partial [Clostridia bacterium]|nr:aminotransferase class V-fold PLP-dependent enzyme [Clostridia bacterium]